MEDFFKNKINVTRSWPFSFLCCPVALVSSLMSHERTHVSLNKAELVRNARRLPAINLIKKRDFKDLIVLNSTFYLVHVGI